MNRLKRLGWAFLIAIAGEAVILANRAMNDGR